MTPTNADTDTHLGPAEASRDEEPRKVLAAFFLAVSLYAGMAFGTIAYEVASIDSGEPTTVVMAAADQVAVATNGGL